MLLAVALVFLVIPFESSAQVGLFGVEISPSLVSVDSDESSSSFDDRGKLSGGAMAFALIPFHGFVLQPGIRYSRLGSRRDFDRELTTRAPNGTIIGSTRDTGRTTLSLDYISAVFRARYSFSPSGPYVLAGPEVGYLLSGRGVTVRDDRPADPYKENLTDFIRNVNIVASGGIGFPMEIYAKQAYVQLLYARGLTQIWTKAPHSAFTNEVSVGFGYRF